MKHNDDSPVEVYSAANSMEAHFLKGLLENEGIACQVIDESLQAVAGEVPIFHASPKLWVRPESSERAKAILDDYEERRARRNEGKTDWVCSQCGEENTSEFEFCWNCQHVLDA